jgi:hypothetical protein
MKRALVFLGLCLSIAGLYYGVVRGLAWLGSYLACLAPIDRALFPYKVQIAVGCVLLAFMLWMISGDVAAWLSRKFNRIEDDERS